MQGIDPSISPLRCYVLLSVSIAVLRGVTFYVVLSALMLFAVSAPPPGGESVSWPPPAHSKHTVWAGTREQHHARVPHKTREQHPATFSRETWSSIMPQCLRKPGSSFMPYDLQKAESSIMPHCRVKPASIIMPRCRGKPRSSIMPQCLRKPGSSFMPYDLQKPGSSIMLYCHGKPRNSLISHCLRKQGHPWRSSQICTMCHGVTVKNQLFPLAIFTLKCFLPFIYVQHLFQIIYGVGSQTFRKPKVAFSIYGYVTP